MPFVFKSRRGDRKGARLTWPAGLLLAVVLAWPAMAVAKERVALVIGNNAYQTLPPLANARTDAGEVANKLRNLGFDVVLKLDAGRREMSRALADFEGRLASAEVGLLFYAGHGIASGDKNWLVPADARIEVEADLRSEGVEMADFIQAMGNAGSDLNIVIIDACRDNPLPQRTRSASRGLTVEEVKSGSSGTAIMFSAGPGQTAQDGPPGGHGVFTGALLRYLDRPGLKLEDVFKRTARAVFEETGGVQDPWIRSSVKDDFYFVPGDGAPQQASLPAAAPAPVAPTPSRTASQPQSAEFLFWETIAGSDDPDMFKAYLKKYPDGQFADLARIKVAKLTAPAEQPRAEPAPRPAPPKVAGDVLTDRRSVAEIQRRLNNLGYAAGPVDGVFGAATRRSIAAYEREHGLRVRGEPTQSILASLRRNSTVVRTTPSRPPAPAPTPTKTTRTQSDWQRAIEQRRRTQAAAPPRPAPPPPPRQPAQTMRQQGTGSNPPQQQGAGAEKVLPLFLQILGTAVQQGRQ